MMNCPNCGAKIEKAGAKFCNSCGAKIKPVRSMTKTGQAKKPKAKKAQGPSVFTYELKCKSCGGTLNYEEGSDVLVCPYCGAKEILAESDAVKIEKIRSDAYKEVELGRQKLMAAQMKNEEKKRYAKSKAFVISIILLVISAFGLLLAYVNHAYASAAVAWVQIGLLIFSMVIGFGAFRGRLRRQAFLFVLAAGILIIVFIAVLDYDSYHESRKTEEFSYSDFLLSDKLPDPGTETGRSYTNNSERMSFEADPYTAAQFKDYVDACKEAGYTVDVNQSAGSSFDAYNEEGYHVDLYFSESSGYLSVYLDAPIQMSELTWPTHGLAKLLPAPASGYGKIASDGGDYFNAYIGRTSKTEFSAYVSEVINAGFNVDYYYGDTYFSGSNADGVSVYMDYMGFETVSLRIRKD